MENQLEHKAQSLVNDLPKLLTVALKESEKNVQKKSSKHGQKAIRAYCEACDKLLDKDLVDSIPDDLLTGILRNVTTHVPLFKEYPVLRKGILKNTILLWSSSSREEVRIVALLAIHALCSRYSSLLEAAIKEMYQTYARACKSLTAHTLGQAGLMINGLVEIFSLNPAKGVGKSQSLLRQMALRIQQLMKHPGKDTSKKVYSWQFISMLRFWCELLAAPTTKVGSPYVEKLLAPLGGIISCLLSLPPTPRYYPFCFHVVASSLRLIESRNCFIPVTGALLKIISHVVKQPLYKKSKQETEESSDVITFDFVALCKVAKSDAASKAFLEAALNESFNYIFRLGKVLPPMTLPEAFHSVMESLKKIIKTNDSRQDRNLKKKVEGYTAKLQHQIKNIKVE